MFAPLATYSWLTATNLFGAMCLVLALIGGVPQVWKVAKERTVAGVSFAALGCALLSTVAWFTWGWLNNATWVYLTSLASLPAGILLVLAYLRTHRNPGLSEFREPFMLVVLMGVTLLLDYFKLLPVSAFQLFLGGSILWYLVPSLKEAWTRRDVEGISVGSWGLLAFSATLSLGYGLSANILPEVIYGTLTGLGSFLVLLRVTWWEGRLLCETCPPLQTCAC